MSKPTYEVLTWDTNRQSFTPQAGVRRGPYSLFGLRKALRKLRNGGYYASRFPRHRDKAGFLGGAGDPAVLVQRRS